MHLNNLKIISIQHIGFFHKPNLRLTDMTIYLEETAMPDGASLLALKPFFHQSHYCPNTISGRLNEKYKKTAYSHQSESRFIIS